MNENSFKEDLAIKAQKFIKQNIASMGILIVATVYIFFGIITIKKTGNTIDQILAKGGISYIVGFTMKVLKSIDGLIKGEMDPKFVSTKAFYLSLLDETAPYQQYLPRYCDMENENVIRRNQTAILRRHNIKYEDFISNNLDYTKLDKKQLKAIQKARDVNLFQLTDAILLSDSQVSVDQVKNLNVSKEHHLKFGTIKMAITMALFALIFGVYGVDPTEGFNWTGAIWAAIQIAIYFIVSLVEYFKSYMFMADTYRTVLVRKSNHLERFKNMYKENPNIFKTKEEIEQDVNNKRLNGILPQTSTEQSSWDGPIYRPTKEQRNQPSDECPITKIQQSSI